MEDETQLLYECDGEARVYAITKAAPNRKGEVGTAARIYYGVIVVCLNVRKAQRARLHLEGLMEPAAAPPAKGRHERGNCRVGIDTVQQCAAGTEWHPRTAARDADGGAAPQGVFERRSVRKSRAEIPRRFSITDGRNVHRTGGSGNP